jgi:hypothetical protein
MDDTEQSLEETSEESNYESTPQKYRKKVKVGQASQKEEPVEAKANTEPTNDEPEHVSEGATKRKKVKIKPNNA